MSVLDREADENSLFTGEMSSYLSFLLGWISLFEKLLFFLLQFVEGMLYFSI
jgi:hypothetical protein